MKTSYFKYIYIILGISMTLIMLLTAVELVSFNVNHYKDSFIKYNISEATGMDEENLEHTTRDLLAYLKDEKEELDTKAVVHGELREVFGTREKLHMVDVKDLFVAGRRMRNTSLMVYTILLFVACFIDRNWKRNLSKTMLCTALVNVLLLLGLYGLMQMDFNKYFDYFHYIFFDNDLWILDPTKEILIQMLPEGFFYDTAIEIIVFFVGGLAALAAAGYINIKRANKKFPV